MPLFSGTFEGTDVTSLRIGQRAGWSDPGRPVRRLRQHLHHRLPGRSGSDAVGPSQAPPPVENPGSHGGVLNRGGPGYRPVSGTVNRI